MAKKKQSTATLFLRTPFSLKRLGILGCLTLGILAINVQEFSQQKDIPNKSIKTMSQSDLQNVLGTSISFGDIPHTPAPESQDPLNMYWREMVTQKPNYPDGYLILATIAFNKHNCQDTRFYLEKAYALDPNSKSLQTILPNLKRCLDR